MNAATKHDIPILIDVSCFGRYIVVLKTFRHHSAPAPPC